MSVYALQKLIREVNRNPKEREAFFASPAEVAAQYSLSDAERDALVRLDYGTLYALGVHGLLLRPFSILYAVSEPDYLKAIRKES